MRKGCKKRKGDRGGCLEGLGLSVGFLIIIVSFRLRKTFHLNKVNINNLRKLLLLKEVEEGSQMLKQRWRRRKKRKINDFKLFV